jgi:predicted amidohydrolase YtcJ
MRHPRLLWLAIAACGPSTPAVAPVAAPVADLIVYDAKITTLDDAHPEVTALAVANGEIVATGDDLAMRRLASSTTRSIDAHGRRVIPGLIDDHAHYIRGGLTYNLEVRWDGVPSLTQALRLIHDQAQRTPAGQWVRVVGGWTPWQFAERRLPTRAELDAASPDRPVYVQYFYSVALVNTLGIKELGFTKDTQTPPGTRLEKDAAGELTGALIADPHPGLMYETVARLPPLSPEDQQNSTIQLFLTLARYGLTGEVDAGGGGHEFPKDYAAATAVAAAHRLAARAAFNLFAQHPGTELEDFQNWMKLAHAGQKLDTEDILELHGAGEYLLWATTDFENFRSARPEIKPEAKAALRPIVQEMVRHRWPFSMHATYDETIAAVLDVLEDVDRETPFAGLRFSFEHAETISERSMRRVKALGGGVSVQSKMVVLGDDFVTRYGADAARHAPPLRKLLELGVPFGLGTDATRNSFNPFVTLHWAITGKTASGRVLYDPDNRLTRVEALRAHTVGSAWFAGEDDHRGRLRAGQRADFAMLTADYFGVPEDAIPQIESVLTVVNGHVVYAAGEYGALGPAPLAPSPSWSAVGHQDPYWRAPPPR